MITKSIASILVAACGFTAAARPPNSSTPASGQSERPLSPSALAATADGRTLYIACATSSQVLAFDTAGAKVVGSYSVPDSPSGLALSPDNARLYVTCAAPSSTVRVIALATGQVIQTIPAGHTAMAPVLSPDAKTLYVCNRFNNEVAVIDLSAGQQTRRIPVAREPVAAALTQDGTFLWVANHLHNGRSDRAVVASSISVIDTVAGKVVAEIALPNGSGLLRDVRISPDGKSACVTHLLSRFHLPTTQLDRGWINSNALSLIDLLEMKLINTVLLDNVDRGAANPWAAAWTSDGKTIVVTHAGTHELSVIEVPALLAKLAKLPSILDPQKPVDYSAASRIAADVPNDLAFLVGLRKRIKLEDKGPRALAIIGNRAYVANYFSDSLSVVDLQSENCRAASVSLGASVEMSALRRGEFYFNDASICFQGWQSCASCHSSDARVDGLNWDNLNDGIGNPKNVKSLLLSHQTPPAMWLAVRGSAEEGVRAGIRHSLFTVQPEEVPAAIDEYLKSLRPIPSPYLVGGKRSPAAARGEKVFLDENVGCINCHKPGLFTDLRAHDVGTRGQFDKPMDRFDTPTLIEIWRSAPYLHDGSSASLRDVVTARNARDQHGHTSHLTPQQIDDLVAYLLAL
ncbi:MAG: beta-propeller fold lactonase family protein [Verrucomicrobia bacterium]|nr:beta-propeller fold lactonase family protein [Verrucomicrobiota bacterium]